MNRQDKVVFGFFIWAVGAAMGYAWAWLALTSV